MLGVIEPYRLCARVELLERTSARVVEAWIAPACRRLRAPNLDPPVVPIDVLPLQASDLAGAQAAVEGECRGDVREDQFRKVLSGIGTYVNLAGGHVYPEKVMASERKPIRIFMIDGRNDNRGVNADGQYDQRRDWFYQNVRLKEALVAKGYDVNYVWRIAVHSHDMGGAMLPEMMRWLWRDHPVSVDPNDTIERSFRTGKPAEPSAAPPPGPNPAGAR